MRKVIGVGCIVLGLVCLLISVGFVVYNRLEAERGEKASQELLQTVQANISAGKAEAPPEEIPEETHPEETQPQLPQETEPQQMLTVQVGNYRSIGVLSIPVLELKLPVLTDWSYEKLRDAPCQYFGSCYTSDFVIAAHNYPSHFGRLSQLQAGDLVLFTDVAGDIYCYEVVLLETLPPTATKEMITSGFELSLYTCTPGGSNRVTVRCRAVNP